MERIDCFTRGTVVRDLESTAKYDAIRELVRKAPVFRSIDKLDDLEDALVTREKIQSTGLGSGVAVAHGKTQAVGDIVMALGISCDGIEFNAHDNVPVHLLFVVANPPAMQLEYVLALSVIMRVIRDDRFRDELVSCRTAKKIEKRLTKAFASAMIKRGFPFS